MRTCEIFKKLNDINDGSRTLFESIPVPEVNRALRTWKNLDIENAVLIGGCAISYYTKPRATMDIDFLFKDPTNIPQTLSGFKRNRTSSFEHLATGVEVETVTSRLINIPQELVDKVFETSNIIDGVRVASPTGLVALKLQRLKRYDIGDIVSLLELGNVDVSGWPLSTENLENLEKIKKEYM